VLLDKTNAGERLADELVDRGIDPDVVLGILGGGLPVADVVSDRLNVPLEVTATKQITPPGDPGYEVGAVTADGIAWYESCSPKKNAPKNRLQGSGTPISTVSHHPS
jgi:predicted phosphoribosyltransferase